MHAQASCTLSCSCAHTKALLHAIYPSHAGRSFFDSLDRNGDGVVSLDDLRSAMRARKLPEEYAHQFLARARRGRWWVQRVRCGVGLGAKGILPWWCACLPVCAVMPDQILIWYICVPGLQCDDTRSHAIRRSACEESRMAVLGC